MQTRLVLIVALKTRLPVSRTAETLGALSYPLYAVHAPVMLFGLAMYGRLFGWKAMPMPIGLILIGATILFFLLVGPQRRSVRATIVSANVAAAPRPRPVAASGHVGRLDMGRRFT